MKLGDEVNFSELQRQSAFLDEARRRHIPCSISPDYARDSEVWQAPLSRWIAGLPKPAGLLCVSDSVGGTVLESCYLQNLSVPEQVSVLGVDNDEKLCTLFHPPLSSISVSLDSMAERIGTLLETAFRTGSMPSGTFPIKPSGIVERETTGRVFLEDPMVAQAFRTLRHHAFEPVNIKELFADTRYTRRQFDHRFRMLVGRTPFEELCRLRVERAKQHLRETRRPLAEIATVCGFSGTTQMRRVFMTVVGAPPQHFRSIQ